MDYKKILQFSLIFICIWVLTVFMVLAGVIAFAFIAGKYFSFNLEMGWMAVIIIFPPLAGTLLAIPVSFFIIKKEQQKTRN